MTYVGLFLVLDLTVTKQVTLFGVTYSLFCYVQILLSYIEVFDKELYTFSLK